MLSAPLAFHRFHSYTAAFVVFEIMLAVSCLAFLRLGSPVVPARGPSVPCRDCRRFCSNQSLTRRGVIYEGDELASIVNEFLLGKHLDGKAILLFSPKGEDFRMINYQTITALVNQIPADTWDVLLEIKERRPAMMLSELMDYRKEALQKQAPPEPRSHFKNEPI